MDSGMYTSLSMKSVSAWNVSRTSKENRRRQKHELNVSSLLHHARSPKIHKCESWKLCGPSAWSGIFWFQFHLSGSNSYGIVARKRLPASFKRLRTTPVFIDLTADDLAPESEVKDVRRCHQVSFTLSNHIYYSSPFLEILVYNADTTEIGKERYPRTAVRRRRTSESGNPSIYIGFSTNCEDDETPEPCVVFPRFDVR
jgi:hypothetical protein